MNETNIDMASFIKHRFLFMLKGIFLASVGLTLAVLCVINQEPRIMTHSSWLPIIALILLVTGVFETINAFVAKKTPIALLYSSLAIVDIVVGIIILFELHNNTQNLVLVAVAYLFIKGFFRISAALQTKMLKYGRIVITGTISVILAYLLWFFVPDSRVLVFIPTFIAIDIMMRGCSLMILAHSLSNLHKEQQAIITKI